MMRESGILQKRNRGDMLYCREEKPLFSCRGFSLQGERHGKSNMPGQDRIGYVRKGAVQGIFLCDAVSENRHAPKAVQEIGKAGLELACECYASLYRMPIEDVQYYMAVTLKRKLFDMTYEISADLKDLGSTFLAAVASTEDETFMLYHLGDGVCGAVRDGKYEILSHPENGISRDKTRLTTDSRLSASIRVCRGDLNDIRELFLFSDGFRELSPCDEGISAYRAFAAKPEAIVYNKDDVGGISLV